MEILLQVILILVNAFFAGTEMAVVSLNATKLRKMQEEGDKIAGKLLSMVEDSSAFLSTIQVAITLAGYLGAAFAGENFAPVLSSWLYNDLESTGAKFSPANRLKQRCHHHHHHYPVLLHAGVWRAGSQAHCPAKVL